MKRIQKLACLFVLVFLSVTACGSDEYGEVQDLLSKQVQVTEDYVNGLEQASSADDVAAAIDRFTEGLKTLIPEIKESQEKFPELWDGEGEVPKEIKAEQERLEAANSKIQGATMNMMKYMGDPKVQQAMDNMGREMSRLQ
ncbi:MAG: hypothetical protein ACLFUP_09385 [Desulfobacteraceae bacterium]